MSVSDDLSRFERAKHRRQTWESVWQEIYDYTMPARDGLREFSPGTRRDDLIFDETAVVGVQEFASRMLAGMVPDNMRWIRLAPTPAVMRNMEDADVAFLQGQLDEVNAEVFQYLQSSNFLAEAFESFLDLSLGSGNLTCWEGSATQPLRFQSVPTHEVYLGEGPFGNVDTQMRLRKVEPSEVKIIWPAGRVTKNMSDKMGAMARGHMNPAENNKIDIVEIVSRDWDRPEEEVYLYKVIDKEEKSDIFEDEFVGIGSNPWISFRWSKGSGEIYGRGPAFNAMSAIKTCNLTVQLILENAEMSIAGIWQSDDDSVINSDNIRLVPGTVIPRGVDSTGLQPLSPGGDFNVADLVLKDQRHNINRALYNETLGRREGTPISATEVAERMAELSRQVGSAHGRLQKEMVFPVYKRAVYLLRDQGRIELPTLNGQDIELQAVSPLVRAQRNEDIAQHVNYAQMLGQLFGGAAIQNMLNPQKFAEKLAYWYEIDNDLLTTEDEQRSNVQNLVELAGGASEAGVDPISAAQTLLP